MAVRTFFNGLLLLLSIAVVAAAGPNDNLTVVTNTGTITGLIKPTTPDVLQFQAIPYARPPTGSLRFMPPEPLPRNRNYQVDATQFPPSCPQFKTRYRGIFQDLQPEHNIPNIDQSSRPGAVANSSDEDCLYLAIWAPVQKKTEKGLPVIFFVPGGGYITGGLDEAIQKPHHWVQRSQAHIVVILNYRMSIFGWPNAPGLESPNVGLLDMRLAIEWVKENIAYFGGDPDRIILQGESAGAVMLDMYSYTHHSDMLVSGLHLASGTAITPIAANTSPDLAKTNFTYVAEQVGCAGLSSSPKAQLSCMQEVPWRTIVDFIGQYLDNQALIDPTMPLLAFTPVPDEVTVFSDYTTRYQEGSYSNLPIILSNAANEASAIYPAGPVYEAFLENGTWPDQSIINSLTLQVFVCPTAQTTANRIQIAAPTYRYLYAANITSIPPLPFLGAHHLADIPSVMGSWKDVVGVPPEEDFARRVGEAMQDALLAFAENPEGVADTAGWPEAASGKLLLFGGAERTVQVVDIQEVDGACEEGMAESYRWSWD